jgi:asparagine synthase (glutamine-hydrolysing)
MARLLRTMSPARWNRMFELASPLLPARLRVGNAGDKVHKLAGLLSAASPESIYLRLVSHWDDPSRLVLNAQEPTTAITDPSAWLDSADFEHRMMYLDTVTYLPDDILVKVDRAAMAVSLETRVPMLDHRVVEFAWRLSPCSAPTRQAPKDGVWCSDRSLAAWPAKRMG